MKSAYICKSSTHCRGKFSTEFPSLDRVSRRFLLIGLEIEGQIGRLLPGGKLRLGRCKIICLDVDTDGLRRDRAN